MLIQENPDYYPDDIPIKMNLYLKATQHNSNLSKMVPRIIY
jgi:hypothetical protein